MGFFKFANEIAKLEKECMENKRDDILIMLPIFSWILWSYEERGFYMENICKLI